MIDRLDIIQVFQNVQQLLHAGRIVAFQIDGVFSTHGHFSDLGFESGHLQRGLDLLKIRVIGQHLNGTIVIRDDVLGTGFQNSQRGCGTGG